MNITQGQLQTIDEAIEVFGRDLQIEVAVEEMAELIKILMKFQRFYKHDHAYGTHVDKMAVVEEIADVYIVINALKKIFVVSDIDINAFINLKMMRLAARIENHRKQENGR